MITKIEGKEYIIPQVKLSYCSDVKPQERPKVRLSKDIADIFWRSFDIGELEYQEFFKVVYLNCQNHVLGIHTVTIGGIDKVLIDIKVLFTGALLANASFIIVCHNHPSGTVRPSIQDDELTRKIKNAGEILQIKLLDHIILTTDGYYSYNDEGRI